MKRNIAVSANSFSSLETLATAVDPSKTGAIQVAVTGVGGGTVYAFTANDMVVYVTIAVLILQGITYMPKVCLVMGNFYKRISRIWQK